MSEHPEFFDNQMSSAEDLLWLQFIENWLALAPPDLAQAAHLAAVPHRFELTLLSMLRGTTDGIAIFVQRLEQAGLLITEGEEYILRPRLRTLLLRRWQSKNLTRYRRANRRAAAFYQDRLPGHENDQVEYVYHQLGSDDRRGIDALCEAFEQAWATRQFGLAERVLRVAQEQVAVLDAESRAWLRYFQARLDLAYQRDTQSEKILASLVDESRFPRLQAEALVTFANLLVQTQRWREAFVCYERALHIFQSINEHIKAARVLEAQGMWYVNLATNLGGLSPEANRIKAAHWRWLFRLRYAPFLLYRWCSRRITFLPNLYFGTDYQDWIIIRLLYEAIHYFEHSIDVLPDLSAEKEGPVANLIIDLQIRLADLYHRVGKWSKAESLFLELSGASPVIRNDYRHATLQLALGRAALARLRFEVSQTHLQAAQHTFQRYGDQRADAAASHLLGELHVMQRDFDTALPHYHHSLSAFLAVNDLLMATHLSFVLEKLREDGLFSAIAEAQVDIIKQTMTRRAYIARFPGTLLERFRKLAIYGVTPLTYLIIFVITIFVRNLFWTVEKASLVGLTSDMILFLLIQPLPLWIYDFFYLLAGWIVVRRLSFFDLVQRQPKYVVTLPEGLIVRDEEGKEHEMRWEAVTRYVTVDRSLWKLPISILSRVLLIGKESFVLDGIMTHYLGLQHDIRQHLALQPTPIKPETLNYSFLYSRWTVLALLLTILMGTVAYFDWLDPDAKRAIAFTLVDGKWHRLPLTSILLAYYRWALYFFPLIGIARLLANRIVVRRTLRLHLQLRKNWSLWLALILFILLTLLEIWILAA